MSGVRINIAGTYPATIATYRLTNKLTGHFYIGSTNNLARRLNRHRNDLEKGRHHATAFQRAFHSWEYLNIDYVVHITVEEAVTTEQDGIDDNYTDPLCCNMATGSSSFWTGEFGMPQEIRDKIAAANRGRKYGDEFREKCRQRMLGSVMSANQKQKISDSLFGRVRTDEERKNISRGNKGKLLGRKIGSEAALKAIDTKRLNGTLLHTQATRIKIAEANYKPVIIEGIEYPSLQAAGLALGYGRQTVATRINSTTQRFREWKWKTVKE